MGYGSSKVPAAAAATALALALVAAMVRYAAAAAARRAAANTWLLATVHSAKAIFSVYFYKFSWEFGDFV